MKTVNGEDKLVNHFSYFLTAPIFIIPLLSLYELLCSKTAFIIWISFIISASVMSLFDSPSISVFVLLLSLILFKYCSYILSLIKCKHKKIVIVVENKYSDHQTKCSDGTINYIISVINTDNIKTGSILYLKDS